MDVSQYLEILLMSRMNICKILVTRLMVLEKKNLIIMIQLIGFFIAAHSLKGMAGTMGYKRMQNLTYDMGKMFSLRVENSNMRG